MDPMTALVVGLHHLRQETHQLLRGGDALERKAFAILPQFASRSSLCISPLTRNEMWLYDPRLSPTD